MGVLDVMKHLMLLLRPALARLVQMHLQNSGVIGPKLTRFLLDVEGS